MFFYIFNLYTFSQKLIEPLCCYLAQPQYLLDKNTYSSLDILHVQSYKRRVTLKCIVRHPALHNSSLMNFVKIGQNRKYYIFFGPTFDLLFD